MSSRSRNTAPTVRSTDPRRDAGTWSISTTTAARGSWPSTPDSLPIIGPVPGADGVFAASGHGMLGLTPAPATAQALAALITTGSAPVDLAPFEVGRFGRRTGAAQVAARFEQGN
ncbi:FAD-dependent oxidoreductase [Saccharopolyspora shandongensis]|uniref:FAD-dependent oxidoreductase n=1 Tax=Saccharopolyspora shandongensis TaxID=418495 RepID=UPI0033C8824C